MTGPPAQPRRSVAVTALALFVMAAAGAATLLGADRGRERFDAADLARRAVEPLLGGGPAGTASLQGLRRRLAHRPLDGVARVLYAGALDAVARGPEDRTAAPFHARTAATLAPTTHPVVRGAALILARCGREEEALSLARRAFDHDPAQAARLLADLEPYLSRRAVGEGLGDGPEAWAAWARRLMELGRRREAEERLSEAVLRWPGYLRAREILAGLALGRGGPAALAVYVPPDLPLPPDPAAARLLGYRALARAHRGDAAGARADIEEVLRLKGDEPSMLSLAADALEAVGDVGYARDHYRRALYRLGAAPSSRSLRGHLLVRIARLEDRHGSAADALRAWREVAREFPELDAARRRLAELEGSAR